MGYADDPAGRIPPDEVKAIIQSISAAAIGYVFALIVSGRGAADMWEVQIQRKGSDTWQTIQSATGKSADIQITPTTPGQPRTNPRPRDSKEKQSNLRSAFTPGVCNAEPGLR